MTVSSEFYKHSNFGTPVSTFSTGSRYQWVKFGSTLKNEISSIRGSGISNPAHIFSYMNNDFTGRIRSLNMKSGWTSWWSYVGDSDNDNIESAIMVNRGSSEWVLSAKEQLGATVKQKFGEAVAGSQAKLKGDPRFFVSFWPSWDPTKKFLSLQQDLTIELDWWWDYDARVTYDIYLYLDGAGKLRGYVAWVHDWVEGGIFSGDIYDELHPKLMAGANTLNAELQNQLAMFQAFTLRSFYYLPGSPPNMEQFGTSFDYQQDATLVVGL